MPKSIEDQVKDLNGQVAALEKSAAEDKAALTESTEATKVASEALKACKDELASKDAELSTKDATISTQATEIASMKAESKIALDAMAEVGIKPDASAKINHESIKSHVEKLASIRAVEIMSSIGAASGLETGAPDASKKEVTVALTGKERVIAKFKKQNESSK
jgi:hypothetical protein